MIKFKHLYLLIFFGIFLLPNWAISQEKNWTLLVYLIGSDLESGSEAGTTDIIEMINGGTTENVNVVVLTGGANKEGWKIPSAWLYSNGEEISLDYEAGGKEMSSAENVTAFINWGLENFPGQKVALTFWNHGSDIRGYGNDEVSGGNLSVPNIKEALSNTNFIQNNNRFELLGFDACLMGNIETVSTLQEYCNWYVGSEEQEPGHGWNYTPIVQALNMADTNFSGDDLGQVIVDGFIAQANQEQTTALTLGVINPTKIPALESSLILLFNQLVSDSKIVNLHKARAQAEEYSKSIQNPEYSEDMVDIGDLMKKLKGIDPELAPLVDDVLLKLDDAISYSKNDMARPRATGLSMYIPHNVLVDEDELYDILDKHYYPIDFSLEIRDFIYDKYVVQALDDNFPPSGQHISDFTFFGSKKGTISGRNANVDEVSAIRVAHNDDLEQVQVLLIEELAEFPDEYLMLGSTHADTVVYEDQGTEIYAYKWDEHWLGINGHPAYIADLHDYEVEDEDGNIEYYTRIHIPIVKNLDLPGEEFLIVAYSYDEDFNYELESIIPEPYEDADGNMIVPKKRVFLMPGDQIQLLYEGFNEVTDEEFFVVDDNAIFTIENGNDDLVLEYDKLDEGNYQIAYLLEDHSQNDTLIFDPTIYTVLLSGIETIYNNGDFELFPNPTGNTLNLTINELNGKNYELRIFDMMGRLVNKQISNQETSTINLDLADGIYIIEVNVGTKRIVDKFIIQK